MTKNNTGQPTGTINNLVRLRMKGHQVGLGPREIAASLLGE
jgi:hypothetical protein